MITYIAVLFWYCSYAKIKRSLPKWQSHHSLVLIMGCDDSTILTDFTIFLNTFDFQHLNDFKMTFNEIK